MISESARGVRVIMRQFATPTRIPARSSRRHRVGCRPDIIILDASGVVPIATGEPLTFIEVVRTHLSERAVAVAKQLDISLFVIPAPGENVALPLISAAHPDPSLGVDEPNTASQRL